MQLTGHYLPTVVHPATMSLSASQNQAIEITERVTSSLSIFGALFVISTYITSSSFHKPVNRIIFYASWGNIIANISTLISLSGIQAGRDSAMCQTQGFLIQMWASRILPEESTWMLTDREGSCQRMLSGRWQWPVMSTLHFAIDFHPVNYGAWRGNICSYATGSHLFRPLFTPSCERNHEEWSMGLPLLVQ